MTDISIYQVDAFTGELFGGNPAAVCPLEAWLPDATLQAIAAENNLAETAFFVANEPGGEADYALRWFTPSCEVELCGHATLASAFIVFERLQQSLQKVGFSTKSGVLTVCRDGDRLELDLPALPATPCDAPAALVEGLGATPVETALASNYLAVLESEAEVASLAPDMESLAKLHPHGVIATAPADAEGVDFVSRYFAPSFGIPEDPVTGSAHCTLTPYWAARLGRPELEARQISSRGGVLWCQLSGERVAISGQAILYLEGTLSGL